MVDGIYEVSVTFHKKDFHVFMQNDVKEKTKQVELQTALELEKAKLDAETMREKAQLDAETDLQKARLEAETERQKNRLFAANTFVAQAVEGNWNETVIARMYNLLFPMRPNAAVRQAMTHTRHPLKMMVSKVIQPRRDLT